MRGTGNDGLMPLQWSSAFEGLLSLTGNILANSIYSDCILGSRIDLNAYRKLFRILSADEDWVKSSDSVLISDMLQILAEQLQIDDKSNNVTLRILEYMQTKPAQKWRTSWGGSSNVWIVKPVGLSCGENITVVKGLKQVLGTVRSLEYKCVVQKYIEKPLLVRSNRKFDIRQWVLVTNIDPLIIYGFSECYLRVSSVEYTLDDDKLSSSVTHLCNHAIQKMGVSPEGNIDHGKEDSNLYCETMMTQHQFSTFLSGKKTSINVPQASIEGDTGEDLFSTILRPQIMHSSIAAVQSVRDKLERVGKGFEWLGLDFMVTENMDVLLLEVNVSPDISHSTPVTARLVDYAVQDLFSTILQKDEFHDTAAVSHSRAKAHSDSHVVNIAAVTDSSTAKTAEQAPHWELWHHKRESSVLQFARKKREQMTVPLKTNDHGLRNEEVAAAIFQACDMTFTSLKSNNPAHLGTLLETKALIDDSIGDAESRKLDSDSQAAKSTDIEEDEDEI